MKQKLWTRERLHVSSEQCLFVGDGGSNELCGAKSEGMATVFSEMLERKNAKQKENIIKYADYHIKHPNELLNLLGKYDNSCNMRKYEI